MDPLRAGTQRQLSSSFSDEDDPYAIQQSSPPTLVQRVADDQEDRKSQLFTTNPKIDPPSLNSFNTVALEPVSVAAYGGSEHVVIQIMAPNMGKHVTYSIRVRTRQGEDNTGVFEIQRRYSDFFALREYFVHRWPGVFIPPIPPKKILKLLEEFLKKTVSIHFLFRTDEFQMFIRGTADFKSTCGQLKRFTISDMVETYEREFHEFSRKEVSSDVISALGVYQQFFKGVLDNLKEFKKVAKTSTDYYEAFHANYDRLAECFTIFEENCLSEYSASLKRPLFIKWNSPHKLNPYEIIYDWIKMESLDVEAILEAMNRRDELQAMKEKMETKLTNDSANLTKLQAGKSTVSGFFSTKSKTTQISTLEAQITQSEEEIKHLESILCIATARLYEFEIPHFKEMKASKYEMVMKSFATMSIGEYEEVVKVCKAIESNLP